MLITLIGAEKIINSIFKINPTDHDGMMVSNISLAPKVVLVVVVTIIPVVLSSRGWTLHPEHGLTKPAPEMAWYQLELLYKQAADSLSDEIGETSIGKVATINSRVLAAGDVGVLGYHTNALILDTVGLNSPQTLNYYPLDEEYYVTNYAVSPDLIMDQKPDYVIILEVYGREGLLKDPRFLSTYHLKQKIPTDIYGSDGMLIFNRVTAF
jgi:hypothetical protein